jgi:hypothetical protein
VVLLLALLGEVDPPAQRLLLGSLRPLGGLALTAPSPSMVATTSASSGDMSAAAAAQASWDCGTCMAMSRSAFSAMACMSAGSSSDSKTLILRGSRCK